MLEVPGYRIEGEAGRGGWSVVYRAVELASGRPVALKVIAPELVGDPGFTIRFRHECEFLARVEHPHVPALLAHGPGHAVMQWVEGTPLTELAPLDPARAARIVAQVGSALDAMHARGLVHRDVKPQNVLVESGDHAYLTDFGLAKEISSDPGLTAEGRWLGTADYAAPEQIRGLPTDARSDVYSLGCVLGFAVTGSVPYPRATPAATMQAHLHEPVPQLPPPHHALNGVLARALAKDPDWRFRTAGDLGRAAVAVTGGTRRRRPSRRVLVVAAASVAVLVAAVAVALLLTGDDDTTRTTEVESLEITTAPPVTRAGEEVILEPEHGYDDFSGTAYLDDRGGEWSIEVDARVKPTERDRVYEIWLYNSRKDSLLLGTHKTDRRGRLQASTTAPSDWVADYSYIDVSLEPNTEGNDIHSGKSVLRGALSNVNGAVPGDG